MAIGTSSASTPARFVAAVVAAVGVVVAAVGAGSTNPRPRENGRKTTTYGAGL
jgi:hypothetical protein